MRDEGVQLVGGVLVLVPHARKTNANTEWNIPKAKELLFDAQAFKQFFKYSFLSFDQLLS